MLAEILLLALAHVPRKMPGLPGPVTVGAQYLHHAHSRVLTRVPAHKYTGALNRKRKQGKASSDRRKSAAASA
jgi:hypothetical protein